MDFEGIKLYMSQKMENGFPAHLHYHNPTHIWDVYQAATKLAASERISSYETKLLLTAVLFHDAGFMEGAISHEEKSCNMARQDLPQFGFQPTETEIICQLIMATRIPQNPQNHLEEIICDADLDYLGRQDFWEIGNKLYEELKHFGLTSDLKDWNKKQVSFLESHNYFTNSSQKLRNPEKEKHLAELKTWLNNRNDHHQKV
jgi:uncharacterized protein